ncbi:hypothetical protein PQU95_03140 [Vogesella sp. DC21W]|uniref:Uncharacterized protein n=1 Tax=Vogesella aquatica TaxID=2984206 RepID=A0ABT5IUG7_9NEIS|nr:hypothetical protein [Vogesella aquatica]MDC7716215.1 hypothetical protein [Vogesella aquatica]
MLLIILVNFQFLGDFVKTGVLAQGHSYGLKPAIAGFAGCCRGRIFLPKKKAKGYRSTLF